MTRQEFNKDPQVFPNEVEELISLYLAGALNETEVTELERRLDGDESGLLDAVAALSIVSEALFEATPSMQPDRSIRESLLRRIDAETAEQAPAESQQIIRRSNEDNWQETGIPGVTMRLLHADLEQKRMTVLMKLLPGASYPSHDHDQAEECLVLEGHLDFGDYELQAGDYLRMAAGTKHGMARSERGCICLVTAALPDALVARTTNV